VDSSAHDAFSRASLEALDEAYVRMSAVREASGHISDFAYDDCNRAALSLLGRCRAEVCGRRLLELFPSHATNGLFDAYARVTETGEPLRCEVAFNDNGVCGEYEILANKFGDGLVLLGHDISKRKRDERQLLTLAEQLQGALTSRVAIEQAKGYLAAKYETDPATAFVVLRRYARNHNVRIHDVAESVVAGRLDLVQEDKGRR